MVIFHSYVKLPEGNHYHHGFHQICVLPAERSARHPAPQQHWALGAPLAPGASVSVGFFPWEMVISTWRGYETCGFYGMFSHGQMVILYGFYVAMKNVDV